MNYLLYFRIISQFVDWIFYKNLARARKESQIAPQASAGCRLLYPPAGLPQSAAGAGKDKDRRNYRTPPPQPRRDTRLRIASNMTFLPSPWNNWTCCLCLLFGLQRIGRWSIFLIIQWRSLVCQGRDRVLTHPWFWESLFWDYLEYHNFFAH